MNGTVLKAVSFKETINRLVPWTNMQTNDTVMYFASGISQAIAGLGQRHTLSDLVTGVGVVECYMEAGYIFLAGCRETGEGQFIGNRRTYPGPMEIFPAMQVTAGLILEAAHASWTEEKRAGKNKTAGSFLTGERQSDILAHMATLSHLLLRYYAMVGVKRDQVMVAFQQVIAKTHPEAVFDGVAAGEKVIFRTGQPDAGGN